MLLVLVSWLGSWNSSGFHTGTSWDHKALGENADAAVPVSLQPCFVHFTQNIHCVPLAEVQILRPSGCVTVPSHYLVEDWSAPGPLWQKGGLQGWNKRGAFPSTCWGWWASRPLPLPHPALEMQPS